MTLLDQADEDDVAGHVPPVPRLRLGDVELLPYDRHPLDIPISSSFWCLPGGEIRTTYDLLRYARQRGLQCSIIINKEPDHE